ncbi:uncharacterized protein DFL_006731 [Arthrobotrys flagrans]|uniref:Uncharacterized protein n=1 Tax=Arthrobotrys flagrans TaxID=97331 RepID=A0A436ZTL9_ARTFL|nr:hypothetical protein DFL_006731 [Arthrobotrys flagrans]
MNLERRRRHSFTPNTLANLSQSPFQPNSKITFNPACDYLVHENVTPMLKMFRVSRTTLLPRARARIPGRPLAFHPNRALQRRSTFNYTSLFEELVVDVDTKAAGIRIFLYEVTCGRELEVQL